MLNSYLFLLADSTGDNHGDQTKRYIYSPTGLYPAPVGKNTKSSHMTKLKNKFRFGHERKMASMTFFFCVGVDVKLSLLACREKDAKCVISDFKATTVIVDRNI